MWLVFTADGLLPLLIHVLSVIVAVTRSWRRVYIYWMFATNWPMVDRQTDRQGANEFADKLRNVYPKVVILLVDYDDVTTKLWMGGHPVATFHVTRLTGG